MCSLFLKYGFRRRFFLPFGALCRHHHMPWTAPEITHPSSVRKTPPIYRACIGHVSGIYRASIGHLSDIYRKIPTDVRLMRGLCVVSAWSQNGLKDDSYFERLLLLSGGAFFCTFSSRSNAMGGVKDIFETKARNKRKNKGQKEPGMRKMCYI